MHIIDHSRIRSSTIVIGGIAAGVIALAACSSSSSTSTTAGSANSGSTPSGSAQAAPITIGLFAPLAASAGGYGVPIQAGLNLYINQVNAQGGVNGHKIDVQAQDNQGTSSGGVTSVQKLLASNPEPVAILGGFYSDSTVAALPIIERAQVPLLVDGAASTSITKTPNPWVFRWVPDNQVVADATIQNLKAHNITKIAIVGDSTSYGTDGASALAAAAKAQGVQVLSTDHVDLSSPDFASIIARLQNEHPGAVALWLTQAETLYTQYGQSGLKNVPLAGQVDLTQKAITSYGLHGWDTYQYSPAISTPKNTTFIAQWTKAGQKIQDATSGYDGYEAGQVMVAALRQTTNYTPAGVQQALKNLDYKPTLAGGQVKFDDHGQAHDNVVNVTFAGSKQTTQLLTPAAIK
jgi:branched-chain amino acid transport system substrate-binding protein